MASAIQGIAWAVPYVLGKTVQNYQVLDCGYNLGQAVCIQKTSSDLSFSARIDKIANRFFLIDSISFITAGIDLFIKTKNKYKIIDEIFGSIFSVRSPEVDFSALGMTIVVPLGTLGAIAFGTTFLINKHFQTSFGELIEGAQWTKPTTERLKQALFVARIVVNIALVCFSPMSPFLALSISAELYSLVKIAQRKWLRFTIERDYELTANKLCFDYTFLLQRGSSRHQQTTGSGDRCGICLENKPDTHFCNSHVFHQLCIQRMLKSVTESFVTSKNLHINERIVYKTKHMRNGVHTHSTYHASYIVQANQKDLPCCPICRTMPEHSEISIDLHDVQYGWSKGHINWTTT